MDGERGGADERADEGEKSPAGMLRMPLFQGSDMHPLYSRFALKRMVWRHDRDVLFFDPLFVVERKRAFEATSRKRESFLFLFLFSCFFLFLFFF